MIKRLIFDLDDTLIDFKKEYYSVVFEALDENKIPYEKEYFLDYFKIEKEYLIGNFITRKGFVEAISNNTKIKFNETVLQSILDKLKNCVPESVDKRILDTLDYLSSKYELYILTNWFYESQYERLKKCGMEKYFTKVYGIDDYYSKPHPKSFERACKGLKKEECIFIGNSYDEDFLGAKNFGIDAILLNRENEKCSAETKTINNLWELRNIL